MGPDFSNAAAGKEEGAGGPAPAPGRASRARYLHPLDHYESIYGTKARAMKRWIAIGRDASPPELPPLDEPSRMKMWWVRCMSQRVPDKILALAKGPPPPPSAPAAPASPGPLFTFSAGAALPSSVSSSPPSLPPSVGFAGALQRLRAAEAAAGELYTTLLRKASAETEKDLRAELEAEAERARRSWDDLVDRLRAMERDAEKILSAGGRMWSADDVLASQEVIHLALREGVRGLIRRIRPKLIGLPPADQESVWLAEADSLFAGLRANKFTAPPAAVAA